MNQATTAGQIFRVKTLFQKLWPLLYKRAKLNLRSTNVFCYEATKYIIFLLMNLKCFRRLVQWIDDFYIFVKTSKDISSIHVFFLRNRLYLGGTDVTSFRVQFWKWGRGLLREGKQKRESGLCVQRAGVRIEILRLETCQRTQLWSSFSELIPIIS